MLGPSRKWLRLNRVTNVALERKASGWGHMGPVGRLHRSWLGAKSFRTMGQWGAKGG